MTLHICCPQPSGESSERCGGSGGLRWGTRGRFVLPLPKAGMAVLGFEAKNAGLRSARSLFESEAESAKRRNDLIVVLLECNRKEDLLL